MRNTLEEGSLSSSSSRSSRSVSRERPCIKECTKKKSKAVNKKRCCKSKICGLRNLGNTCFMNAVLQSLSNIQQFSCYFKQLPSLERHRLNGNRLPSSAPSANNKKVLNDGNLLLAEELRKTLVLLCKENRSGNSSSAISPESLFTVIWKVVPRFRGYRQQDAHEFLRYMLDRLHTELLGTLPYPPPNYTHNPMNIYFGSSNVGRAKSTIVTAIFGGVLQNEVTCLVCGTESKKHDPFLDLSLDIPQRCSPKLEPREGEDDIVEKCHLFDCLSSFVELEECAETELYHCPNCKKKQRFTKRFWVRRLPNVLCLHLKRFWWNNYCRSKLDTFVEFPMETLDMSKYVLSEIRETRGSGGSALYDLAAVIVHHGNGSSSGHYTAYATHENCWHHFNDSTVTVCDENTVAKSNAYILFYIRRELNLSPFTI